jgi:hypothetical protein
LLASILGLHQKIEVKPAVATTTATAATASTTTATLAFDDCVPSVEVGSFEATDAHHGANARLALAWLVVYFVNGRRAS